MDFKDWVVPIRLESPLTEDVLVLLGRNGLTNNLIGSAVFIAPGLALTAKHVVEEFWRLFGTPDVRLEHRGDKSANFEIVAIQYPGERSEAAIWMTRLVWICPQSDIAAISLEPVNKLARRYDFTKRPTLNVLPPTVGERVMAVGYAASKVLDEDGEQMLLSLNPSTSAGVVTHVYPEYRDLGMLHFPCFEIETHYVGGMSGGPIYNEGGDLCGLVCSGQDGAPIAYGVALWPILGVHITHEGQGMICRTPYPISALASVGLLFLKHWDLVAANVEFIEEPSGKKRVRLKPAV